MNVVYDDKAAGESKQTKDEAECGRQQLAETTNRQNSSGSESDPKEASRRGGTTVKRDE
jgi:hypothetical protein